MKGKVLGIVSAVLLVVASLASSTASFMFMYQPRAPPSLHTRHLVKEEKREFQKKESSFYLNIIKNYLNTFTRRCFC